MKVKNDQRSKFSSQQIYLAPNVWLPSLNLTELELNFIDNNIYTLL